MAPTTIDAIPLHTWRTEKWVCVGHDFSDGESTDEIRELLTQIADKIAHVKDPLKKHLIDTGRDAKVVERCINGSQALQIVIDIANREKHGYPSDRPSRSGRDPMLGDVGRSLRLRVGEDKGPSSAVYTIDPTTGKAKVITTGGASGMVEYWGEVRDGDSTLVGDILDFCRDGLADWECLFSRVGITLE